MGELLLGVQSAVASKGKDPLALRKCLLDFYYALPQDPAPNDGDPAANHFGQVEPKGMRDPMGGVVDQDPNASRSKIVINDEIINCKFQDLLYEIWLS
ncbi:MAG: hypothetical protein ACI9O0_001390 [Paracoccaceae bacterium]|jgi:hypothetical protein